MVSHFITFRQSTFHYRKYGNGPRLLFCFHGYGKEAESFDFLEERLGSMYTIIVLDAPFHGLTSWKHEMVVEPKFLMEVIEQIIKLHQEVPLKISLLGFSMGGRIALYLTQLMPDKIDRLVLIAPDGLHFNFLRWLLTGTMVGSKLLSYTVHNGNWALWVIGKAEQLKVIHKSMADFARFYMDDEPQRLLLYQRWISMKKFNPNSARIKMQVKKNTIQVRLMFGAFDRVIPIKGGTRFLNGIETFGTLQVVQAGHNLLGEIQAGKIVDLFTN